MPFPRASIAGNFLVHAIKKPKTTGKILSFYRSSHHQLFSNLHLFSEEASPYKQPPTLTPPLIATSRSIMLRSLISTIISFLLITTSLLLPLTNATPLLQLTPRALSIPPAPADPPKAATGDGIGPYASQSPGWRDRLDKIKFYSVAVAAGELFLVNAKRNLRHYLENSGSDLAIAPEKILGGLPQFRDAVKSLAQNQATAAYKLISTSGGEKAFTSPWKSFYATKDQSLDWYFALGGFSYSVTGVVVKSASTAGAGSLKYQAHIFDRYNWDAGSSVDIGPFHFEDTELGNLHLKGLAREYNVRGTSGINSVAKFTEGTVIPPPSTGGR